MREIALNILDLAENSVKAGATLVTVLVMARGNVLTVEIDDNGCGMDEEFLKRVTDPFTTTRTTRKVGMGIPLFKMAAEMAGGEFSISSRKGEGTSVRATFCLDNIDRSPLGDLSETIVTLISGDNAPDFVFTVGVDENQFVFDTRELKAELDGVPVGEPEVLVFVRDMIKENIKDIGGEKL